VTFRQRGWNAAARQRTSVKGTGLLTCDSPEPPFMVTNAWCSCRPAKDVAIPGGSTKVDTARPLPSSVPIEFTGRLLPVAVRM